MPSINELRRQIDVLDRQIVEFLARRTKLAADIHRQNEGEEVDTERQQQVLSNWLEEGFDFDLDEVSMEKVVKAVMEMGRKAKDAA